MKRIKELPGCRGDVGTGPNCWCDLMQVMSSPMATFKKNQLSPNGEDSG